MIFKDSEARGHFGSARGGDVVCSLYSVFLYWQGGKAIVSIPREP